MTLILDANATEHAISNVSMRKPVAQALFAIANDQVSVPARVAAQAPFGVLLAMPGYVAGMGMAAKIISIVDSGSGARHQGVVALFDEGDGSLKALMDAEHITAARTAAVALLALEVLAPTASRIAVIGTGTLARATLAQLPRDRGEYVVAGRNQQAAAELAGVFGISSATTIADALASADAVIGVTSSVTPSIERKWLAKGATVISMGSSTTHEVDSQIVADAELFAEWRGAWEAPAPAGATELQGIDPKRARLIGELLNADGSVASDHRREANCELTLFKSTGHAALDVAAAVAIYEFAKREALGVEI
jgi:alanine dehydrogenase